MRGVLLAAGLGTRLRPITDSIPKCLVPIQGRPLLEYWFELLFESGNIERLLLNLHYFPHAVMEYVKNCRWSERVDLVFEEELLGTGGTIWANRDWFGSEAFFVAHADNLTLFDPKKFHERHSGRPNCCQITMMTFDTDVPEKCGIVEVRDGIVSAFHEKVLNPPGNRANGAVYMFEPEIIDHLASFNRSFIDISADVLPDYLGKIWTFHNDLYHRDIGSPESLAKAELEFPGLDSSRYAG